MRSPAKEPAVRRDVGCGDGHRELSFVVADLTGRRRLAGRGRRMRLRAPCGQSARRWENQGPRPCRAGRDGALRVLRASVDAGVKRVVMTSAAAAARAAADWSLVSDETLWADPDDRHFDAYRVSKLLAERSAWDFMNANGSTEFATILPGAVFGPILTPENLGSVKIIQDLLLGRPPACRSLAFGWWTFATWPICIVRAMISPAAAGERFIATGEFMWMVDIAGTLRANLGDRGSRVPTRGLPNLVVKLLLPFQPDLRTLAPLIGRKFELSTEKARRVLDFAPRPAASTLIECAQSLPT